jgi:hypothetical protein
MDVVSEVVVWVSAYCESITTAQEVEAEAVFPIFTLDQGFMDVIERIALATFFHSTLSRTNNLFGCGQTRQASNASPAGIPAHRE